VGTIITIWQRLMRQKYDLGERKEKRKEHRDREEKMFGFIWKFPHEASSRFPYHLGRGQDIPMLVPMGMKCGWMSLLARDVT
jgi:hypothetical protein